MGWTIGISKKYKLDFINEDIFGMKVISTSHFYIFLKHMSHNHTVYRKYSELCEVYILFHEGPAEKLKLPCGSFCEDLCLRSLLLTEMRCVSLTSNKHIECLPALIFCNQILNPALFTSVYTSLKSPCFLPFLAHC